MFAVKSNYPAQRTRLEHFTRAFQHFKRVKLKWAWVYVQEPLFVTYIYGELRGSLQSAELNKKLANDKKDHNYSAENWKEKKRSGSHETDLGWVESQFKL